MRLINVRLRGCQSCLGGVADEKSEKKPNTITAIVTSGCRIFRPEGELGTSEQVGAASSAKSRLAGVIS